VRRTILRRLALAGPVLVAVSILSFLLVHLVPGDPVDFMLGDSAVPQAKAALRAELHLDRPLPEQYVLFVHDLATGRLTSLHTHEPVLPTLARKFAYTFVLALAAMLVSMLIAVPIGVVSAVKKGTSVDHASMTVALAGVSMPVFWLGPLLVLVFSFKLNWFPVAGARGIASLVLPAVTLGSGMAAIIARMTRASMLETLPLEYVTAARARGLSPMQVVVRHALRNALVPVVTMMGMQFGALLSGSIITEEVFAWPGLGRAIVEAVRARDFPMFQGAVLLVAITYLAVNVLTDATHAALDPRVNDGARS
jgi:ABC-type dipeptide/oligopeptide/nickel transport system permease component